MAYPCVESDTHFTNPATGLCPCDTVRIEIRNIAGTVLQTIEINGNK